MGNNASSDVNQQEIVTSIAAKLLANSTEAQAINLAGLLQSAAAAAAPAPAPASQVRGKKYQCRWCIETFGTKFNKDRHEGRKHPAELIDAEVRLEGDASRKRSSSEMTPEARDDDASTEGQVTLSPESGRPLKRGRVDALEDSETVDAPMQDVAEPGAVDSEHAAAAEPSVEASDAAIALQIDALAKEREDSEAANSGVLFDDDTRQALESADAHISACCLPFLSWLCAPAVTEPERLVKARRVDPKQLPPVKKNLAFVIKLVLSLQIVEPHQFRLDVFTQEAVCRQLNTVLEERQVGASRIYALFLLIKKILVYLSSSESARRREYIAPNTWNSWTCVDTVCSDSNTRRKQISQNRKLLGAEQCKQLGAAPARTVPTADDLRMPAMYGEKKKSKAAPPVEPSTPVTTTLQLQLRADANELKPDELRQVAVRCLAYLNRDDAAQQESSRFSAYLLTATLCCAMAPRQQVMRQLRIGSSFVKKEDGRYHVIMLAHMNKNGRATTFPIGQELTRAFDAYLGTVRPRLLGAKSHDYVFCKQTGDAPGPTFDFSDWTRGVCKELLGRPVNCHAFRAAVVTTYYKTGATQADMNALADVMAHDPATARDYYFKDDAAKQATAIEQRMHEAYGLSAPGAVVERAPQSDSLVTE